MKAMILAAGLGTRMRPLTDHCPKPLLRANGKSLIVHQIERLRGAGLTDIVINVSHLGEQLIAALGNGERLGVSIAWSAEPEPLETAGGIRHALALLGESPFLLINGDVWSDVDYQALGTLDGDLARLVMVDNPAHHRQGDFHLDREGRLHGDGEPRLTYAGIALLDPLMVCELADNTPARLAPLLVDAMRAGRVSGYHHRGEWDDIGTPARLAALDARLRAECPRLRSDPQATSIVVDYCHARLNYPFDQEQPS